MISSIAARIVRPVCSTSSTSTMRMPATSNESSVSRTCGSKPACAKSSR